MTAMGSRERAVDAGAARGRALASDTLRDLRDARLDRSVAGQDVARALGMSASQFSRVERGLVEHVSIQQLAIMAASVGLELNVRLFPAGQPLRDVAHAALLDRLRLRLHRSLRFATEVPLPSLGDRRAWDAVVTGNAWRLGIEAETRPRDRQALERRLALKFRDGDVSVMALLLLDSRHNREFVRANSDVLVDRFPTPSRRALELLAAGVAPDGNAIILL